MRVEAEVVRLGEIHLREIAVEEGVERQRNADLAVIVAGILPVLLGAALKPEHHVMVAAADRQLAAEIGVDRQVARLAAEGAGVAEDRCGIERIVRIAIVNAAGRAAHGIAVDVEERVVFAGGAAQDRDLAGPAVAEIMREIAEDLAIDHAPARPFRRVIGGAIEFEAGAVGIVERDRAPHRAAAAVVLVAVAGADHGIGAEIRLDDAVTGPATQTVAVEVAVGIEERADRAGADRAVLGERYADVGVEAEVVV